MREVQVRGPVTETSSNTNNLKGIFWELKTDFSAIREIASMVQRFPPRFASDVVVTEEPDIRSRPNQKTEASTLNQKTEVGTLALVTNSKKCWLFENSLVRLKATKSQKTLGIRHYPIHVTPTLYLPAFPAPQVEDEDNNAPSALLTTALTTINSTCNPCLRMAPHSRSFMFLTCPCMPYRKFFFVTLQICNQRWG